MVEASDTTRVLLFDSGLGGISVADEIQALLPGVELVYFADNAYFPYGSREASALLRRVRDLVLQLQAHYQPDIIVLACNTASTLVLAELRHHTATPIVGVVPAVKPAAETTSSGVIGLLATPGTVLRDYTAELIREFAGHCEVISVGSSELAAMAEGKMHGTAVTTNTLQEILAPFHRHPRAGELDTIVLACTHFPLLREELQQAFGREIRWLDSGAAIARRVQFLLGSAPTAPHPATPTHRLASSKPLPRSLALEQRLRAAGFQWPPATPGFD